MNNILIFFEKESTPYPFANRWFRCGAKADYRENLKLTTSTEI